MGTLKQPSQGLVQQLLREVSYEERFEGYGIRERSGPKLAIMYRFEELVSFLNDQHPRLDFDDLEVWLRDIMQDMELAAHVNAALSKAMSNQARCEAVRELLQERLAQCQEASRR